MCKNINIYEEIKQICKGFGLRCNDTPVGILVYNGKENFFIKLNKSQKAVRKLYHQNHMRNAKYNPPIRNWATIDNEHLVKNFHDQQWEEDDIYKTLRYIRNHGTARDSIDAQKRRILHKIDQLAKAQ